MKLLLFSMLALGAGSAIAVPETVPAARSASPASAPPSLDALLNPVSPASTGVNGLRAQMLTEGGQTAGFRGGMASRAGILSSELKRKAGHLDRLFQFATLIGPSGTLPPVIVEAKDVASFGSEQIRTADHVYKIEKEERFVSVPPTWRDYLLAGLSVSGVAELPPFEARPRDARESALWRDAVKAGWAAGEKQADAVLDANFNRLTRDITGMLLFAALRQQGLISGTQVAESVQTAIRDKKQLVIGERLKRVTDKASFVADPRKWRASVKGDPRGKEASASRAK